MYNVVRMLVDFHENRQVCTLTALTMKEKREASIFSNFVEILHIFPYKQAESGKKMCIDRRHPCSRVCTYLFSTFGFFIRNYRLQMTPGVTWLRGGSGELFGPAFGIPKSQFRGVPLILPYNEKLPF